MNFLKRCLTVFTAMVLLDVAFALYVVSAANKEILAASTWAGVIQVCNVFVVTSFVNDKRLMVPCVLGAFFGTALALAYIG